MSDYTTLKNLENKLSNKINTIRNMTQNHPDYDALRAEIAELKNQIEAIKAWSKVS